MARPRSTQRRDAILAAAARVVATQGLGAATAAVAREAGVSNGSLFLYFETKAVLLNELYVALKTEMGDLALAELPVDMEPREQLRHLWVQWLQWATSHPERRRALAQLDVADDITAESHVTVHRAYAGIADLLERCRATGPLCDVPLAFVLVLIGAIADASMDALIREPTDPGPRADAAFDAVWRVLAG